MIADPTSCEKIEAAGASTFRDGRDINGGDDIREEIRSQIKQSRERVVLLTPEAVDRPWILLEVGAAWGWRKDYRIVPVRRHLNAWAADRFEMAFCPFLREESPVGMEMDGKLPGDPDYEIDRCFYACP